MIIDNVSIAVRTMTVSALTPVVIRHDGDEDIIIHRSQMYGVSHMRLQYRSYMYTEHPDS